MSAYRSIRKIIQQDYIPAFNIMPFIIRNSSCSRISFSNMLCNSPNDSSNFQYSPLVSIELSVQKSSNFRHKWINESDIFGLWIYFVMNLIRCVIFWAFISVKAASKVPLAIISLINMPKTCVKVQNRTLDNL